MSNYLNRFVDGCGEVVYSEEGLAGDNGAAQPLQRAGVRDETRRGDAHSIL